VLSEETDYMDNIPENLQYSSRYETAEEACDNLQEAVEYIEAAQEVEDDIEKINDYINKSIDYLYDASK
jgi:predicted RNase H-like HicB family nuclease